MKVSVSPDKILCGWLGLKHELTNYLIKYIQVTKWLYNFSVISSTFLGHLEVFCLAYI